MKYTVQNIEDTKRVAILVAQLISEFDVVCLYGEVGAGKTTFAKYMIASLLGADENLEEIASTVTSPTFNIVSIYGSKPQIWHYDLYRIENVEELLEIGLNHAIDSGITIIEWPEIAETMLPLKRINISILGTDSENVRSFLIEHYR